MPNYNLGGFDGTIKFFGIYTVLDMAIICSCYGLLLRHHEKTNYSFGAKALRFDGLATNSKFFTICFSIVSCVVLVRLA